MQTTTAQRGIIFRDTSVADGVVQVGGRQLSFEIRQWTTPQPPRIGMRVEVLFDPEDQLLSLGEVSDAVLAREQAEHLAGATRRQTTAVTGGIRKHFGLVPFLAEMALLFGFFLLPSVSVEAVGRSLTAWDVLGLNLASFSTSDHGPPSLLSVALFAPLVMPFVHRPWARWLSAAPLVYVLLVLADVFVQIEQAGAAVRQAGGDLPGGMADEVARQTVGLLHPAAGAFLVLGCAAYLATRCLKVRT